MKTFKISEFKAKCIRILKTLARSGEPIVITHRGKPIARVEALVTEPGRPILGSLRGAMVIRGDILHSDIDDDFEGGGR